MSEALEKKLVKLKAQRKLMDGKILAIEAKLENPQLVRKTKAKSAPIEPKKTEKAPEPKKDNSWI